MNATPYILIGLISSAVYVFVRAGITLVRYHRRCAAEKAALRAYAFGDQERREFKRRGLRRGRRRRDQLLSDSPRYSSPGEVYRRLAEQSDKSSELRQKMARKG